MAEKGGSRGVEHPISTDMALIGNTKHELHEKGLPRKGPVIHSEGGKGSEVRNQGSHGIGERD